MDINDFHTGSLPTEDVCHGWLQQLGTRPRPFSKFPNTMIKASCISTCHWDEAAIKRDDSGTPHTALSPHALRDEALYLSPLRHLITHSRSVEVAERLDSGALRTLGTSQRPKSSVSL